MDNLQYKQSAPVHFTLTDQSAIFLRQAILSGRWTNVLPSEAELCREMSISRGTLRRAMTALFNEGLIIAGGRGGRHGIAAKHRMLAKTQPEKMTGDIIRVLSPQSRFQQTGLTQTVFQMMSETLARVGLRVEFDHHPGLWKLRRPASALRKITDRAGTAGWVLYRSSKEVQQWFEQSGIPAVVLGRVHSGISLPHAEFDLEAASRHAAGVFASRKHRRMAFLMVDNATAGDQASAKAFTAAATAAGAYAEVATYDDTVPGLCRALDGLLLAKPIPTAFFVAFPNHVPATIGHLTRRGFPVPSSAAVISRMDARLLAESIPSVARYSMDAERLGRGLARLLRRVIDPTINAPISSCIVMPDYIDGETAGGPP